MFGHRFLAIAPKSGQTWDINTKNIHLFDGRNLIKFVATTFAEASPGSPHHSQSVIVTTNNRIITQPKAKVVLPELLSMLFHFFAFSTITLPKDLEHLLHLHLVGRNGMRASRPPLCRHPMWRTCQGTIRLMLMPYYTTKLTFFHGIKQFHYCKKIRVYRSCSTSISNHESKWSFTAICLLYVERTERMILSMMYLISIKKEQDLLDFIWILSSRIACKGWILLIVQLKTSQ